MTVANAFGTPAPGWPPAPGDRLSGTDRRAVHAVRLIDRRIGAVHRINGRPLVIFTRNPEAALAELLDGRDADVWEARAEQLLPEAAR